VRTVPGGANFNLAIELDRISLQRNAKSDQFVGAGVLLLGAGVLFVGAGILRVGADVLRIGAGVLPVSAGMLNFGAVKAILRSLREPLDGVLKHFLFGFHLHTLLAARCASPLKPWTVRAQGFGSLNPSDEFASIGDSSKGTPHGFKRDQQA
jgi:hypothetical protein